MSTVRDLVDSLIAGKTMDIQSNLNSIMGEKLSDVLDIYKTEVARNMFNPENNELESEEDYEETTEE